MNTPTKSYELFTQLHSSKGMEYLNRRKLRAFSFNIFSGNFIEVKKACSIVENPEIGLKLMSESMKEAGTQAHMEVMRLFHNFLAAAKSLVDHTRVFVDEHYAGTGFKQAYEQKVQAEIANDPLMKFIQDLRNYMLHRGLPNGSMSLTITQDPETNTQDFVTTVSIDREKLLQWDRWTKPSQTFLASAEKRIKISDISIAYGDRILAFYEWFDHKLEKHHEGDIFTFMKLQKEYTILQEQEETLRRAI